MSFPDHRSRKLKNELLLLLEQNDQLDWTEFDWSEASVHGFTAYDIHRTNDKENQHFFFHETVPHIEINYKPALEKNELAIKIPNKDYNESSKTVKEHFYYWTQSIKQRDKILNDEKEIDERRRNKMFVPSEMNKPFQDKAEKTIFFKSINETKYKINSLRNITKYEQEFLISIVEVSEKELEVIIPLNEITNEEEKSNQETKQQWFDRLKFRLKSAMNGAKTLLVDSLKDIGKEVVKDAIKEVLKFIVAGTILISAFPAEKQIEVNIVVNNSFHMVQENKLELPIGNSDQLLLNPNYAWENFEFTDNPAIIQKPNNKFFGWIRKKFSVLLA